MNGSILPFFAYSFFLLRPLLGCADHPKAFVINTRYHDQLPPLWSSGQSSWLQIRRPGFDSRH
jgi:hypothetical protein